MTRPRALARAPLACALLAVAALAGCGASEEDAPDPAAQGAGARLVERVELLNCTDWKEADVSRRLAIIDQLRLVAGQPVSGGSGEEVEATGPVLDDEHAYRHLDGYCRQTFARGFLLYLLYVRAAGFADVAP